MTGLGMSEFPLPSSTPSKELEVLAGERKLRGTLLRLLTTKPAAVAANRWMDKALQLGFRLHFLLEFMFSSLLSFINLFIAVHNVCDIRCNAEIFFKSTLNSINVKRIYFDLL